jgi:hypothetical protein
MFYPRRFLRDPERMARCHAAPIERNRKFQQEIQRQGQAMVVSESVVVQ